MCLIPAVVHNMVNITSSQLMSNYSVSSCLVLRGCRCFLLRYERRLITVLNLLGHRRNKEQWVHDIYGYINTLDVWFLCLYTLICNSFISYQCPYSFSVHYLHHPDFWACAKGVWTSYFVQFTIWLIIYALLRCITIWRYLREWSVSIWLANIDGGESYLQSPWSLISVSSRFQSSAFFFLLKYRRCFNIEHWLWVCCGLVTMKPLLGCFWDIVLYGSLGRFAFETSAFQCCIWKKEREKSFNKNQFYRKVCEILSATESESPFIWRPLGEIFVKGADK